MSVQTQYISKVGRDHLISPHFALAEMACKDGSDKVLYSTELTAMLEKLRVYGGFTIRINSGYRTSAHNKRVRRAANSQHLKETAADIVVKKDGKTVSGKLVCCLCQSLGFDGVAYISPSAVHLDVARRTYRGDERKGYSNNVWSPDNYGVVKI